MKSILPRRWKVRRIQNEILIFVSQKCLFVYWQYYVRYFLLTYMIDERKIDRQCWRSDV